MSKHHRQQPWVAPRPEKTVTPSVAQPALTEQESDLGASVAFTAPPMDDLAGDTSYFGAAGAVPETKLPIKHDRLTKDGATYIVVGIDDTEMRLMGPKGVETVATAKLGDYQR